MDLSKLKIDRRMIVFLVVFSVLAVLLSQIQFSPILGVNSQSFTMFQFIGPIAGGIMGSGLGVVSVLFVQIINSFISGKSLDLMAFVFFLPAVFAAIYFGAKGKMSAIVAAVCMIAFWLSPVGGAAWFYPLYWLIPIAASFFKQNIFARSLGATFTAHAVGSVLFLYAFNIPAATWIMLVPIVAVERLTFASGITISYYAVNTILDLVESKTRINLGFLNFERKYSVVRVMAPAEREE